MRRQGLFGRILASAVLLPLSVTANAQSWPSRQIEWIVPFAPGGSTDRVARIIGHQLKNRLGQPIVVVNRPGANADIGYKAAAAAAPDGHTILLTVPSLMTNPFYLKASIDPDRLAPVIYLAEGSYVLLASSKFPANTVGEMMERVRSKPQGVSCGLTGGVGSIGCEMLQVRAKTELLKVPFRGSEPGTMAVMAGDVDLVFNFSITAQAPVDSGLVKALATTGLKRGSLPFPQLPTVAETIPDFELLGWDGVMVPRGTPPDIVMRINREMNAVLGEPDVQKMLREGGLEAVGGTPEEFAARLNAVKATFGRVLTEAGVTPQ
jgi:tripartite-type tricarboxylate transporter receptor subunit TctC